VKKVKLGSKILGEGEPIFIIAEAGSNHDGKFEQAKKLIDVAVKAGADAVKFQTFRAKKLYVKRAGKADYLGSSGSIFGLIKDLEMPYEWLPKIFKYCEKSGILFLSTPFDEESADKLETAGVPAFKISSYTITHLPFLSYVAKKGRPLILSTGGSNLCEVREALTTIYSQNNKDVIVMQCTASYPAPLEHINLKVIDTLKQSFQVPVGISDHSKNPFIVPFAAAARGANVIEKHFTLDPSLLGPDHKYAVKPEDLKNMVYGIRGVEKALGSSVKDVAKVEKELCLFAKRRIQATEDILNGATLTERNIAILRPGKKKRGLHPRFWEVIIGKKVARNVRGGDGITWEDLLQSN
jgi:N,N'-diacetyllegionaminate synthase